MVFTGENRSFLLEGLQQNENFTIELREGTENTTLSNSVILCECGCMTVHRNKFGYQIVVVDT